MSIRDGYWERKNLDHSQLWGNKFGELIINKMSTSAWFKSAHFRVTNRLLELAGRGLLGAMQHVWHEPVAIVGSGWPTKMAKTDPPSPVGQVGQEAMRRRVARAAPQALTYSLGLPGSYPTLLPPLVRWCAVSSSPRVQPRIFSPRLPFASAATILRPI